MRRRIRGAVALTGLMEIRKGGKLYRYFRRKGHPLAPLPADVPLDSETFLAAYAQAKANTKPPEHTRAKPGTIKATMEAARRSERWAGASAAYKSILLRQFAEIEKRGGDAPMAGVRDRHIRSDVRSASNPSARLKAWRFLCGYALDADLIADDPAARVKAPKREKSEGHAPWTADEIQTFRNAHAMGTSTRAAFELLFWTGARISDAVLIGPGMIGKDGVLAFRQTKTGDMAYVPWSCALPHHASDMAADRQMMYDALAACDRRHMTFLATAQGTRSSKALGQMIGKAARALGIAKSAHGLRKARAVALAEGGATVHQIGAWTGHKTLAEIERYTRQTDRRRAVMGTEQARNVANQTGPRVQAGEKP